MRSVVGLLIVVLAVCSPAIAEEPSRTEPLEERIAALRREITTIRTLRSLNLTRGQLQMLHGAATLAESERKRFEARHAEILAEQVRAFRKFLAEDVADRGFSPQVEQATAQAIHSEKKLQAEFIERVKPIEREAVSVLTNGQRRLLERELERTSYALNRANELLDAVRTLPKKRFERRQSGLVGEALKNRQGEITSELRDRLSGALREYRSARASEMPALRKRILAEFFPGARAAEIYLELGRIHREKYGSLSTLGTLLVSPAAVPALETLLRHWKKNPPKSRDDKESR